MVVQGPVRQTACPAAQTAGQTASNERLLHLSRPCPLKVHKGLRRHTLGTICFGRRDLRMVLLRGQRTGGEWRLAPVWCAKARMHASSISTEESSPVTVCAPAPLHGNSETSRQSLSQLSKRVNVSPWLFCDPVAGQQAWLPLPCVRQLHSGWNLHGGPALATKDCRQMFPVLLRAGQWMPCAC